MPAVVLMEERVQEQIGWPGHKLMIERRFAKLAFIARQGKS
jgi:hypothetical protein